MLFTIGCNTELVLRKNGKLVPTSNYYKKNASFGLGPAATQSPN